MSKPEGIPQDVWAATIKLANSDSTWQSQREKIARAILAAKAEEREAIAAFCAEQAPTIVGELFAAAIRKRGEG